MESVYSKFFNGKPSTFGIGTWSSYPKSLNHSATMPLFNSSVAPPLPPVLSNLGTINTNQSANTDLKMQLLEYKIHNLEQKENQINQLNALYNNSLLSPPAYYPLMRENSVSNNIHPYYGISPVNGGFSYKKKKISPSKMRLRYRNKRTIDDEEGIARLKKRLGSKNDSCTYCSNDSIYNRESNDDNKENEEDEPDKERGKTKRLKLFNNGKHFLRNVNNSLALKLQKDTFKTNDGINELKTKYKEIETLLKNKLDQFEEKQKNEMEVLRLALENENKKKEMEMLKDAIEQKNRKEEINTVKLALEKGKNKKSFRLKHSLSINGMNINEALNSINKDIQELVEEKIKAFEMKKAMERERKEKLEKEIRQKVAREIELQKMFSASQKNTISHLPSINYIPNRMMKQLHKLSLLNKELIRREDYLLERWRRERNRREDEERLRRLLRLRRGTTFERIKLSDLYPDQKEPEKGDE